ncbi:L,D-transpeptidase [Embleya scabrispora]|uniref:L,D-transpeptidase n=1 Tax=Embleya scabrispora TaxID=159449 RepID=UPI00036A3596|nr:L,D-transpeptidase [Embleya scabrispora]MYS81224.1 L,D-transpeptidase family protein [Streptomyces sp. SID5474]
MKNTRISLAVTVTAILALSACNSGSSSDSTAKAGAQSPLPATSSSAPVTPAPESTAPTSAAPTTGAPTSAAPTSAKPSTSKPATSKPATKPPTSKPPTTKAKPPAAQAGLDERCLTGRAICIDKRTDRLTWVIDGKAQYSTDVRFGSAETPTREGAFSINFKSRDHVSTLYHTPMPFAMFFSGGQAVHYSADFAAHGYNGASHGCVNVRDKGLVQRLFNETRVGDKVIVYRSAK